MSYVDQHHVLPYAQQWQFGIQQRLTAKTVLEMNFVRMLSVKGFQTLEWNEIPDNYLPLGTLESSQLNNPFYGLAPITSSLGASRTFAQSRL